MKKFHLPMNRFSVTAGAFLLAACSNSSPALRGTPSGYADASSEDSGREPSSFGRKEKRSLAYCAPYGRDLRLGEECVAPDEKLRFEDMGRRINAVQDKHMALGKDHRGHDAFGKSIRRGFHAKAHGCLQATFTVLEDIPEELSHGIFEPGRVYEAWTRFSNGTGTIHADAKLDVRGLGIKVMGVEGDRLHLAPTEVPGVERSTQDFLMTNKVKPTTHTPEEFVQFAEASVSGPKDQVKFFVAGRRFEEFVTLTKESSRKIDSLAKETYWSGGAIALGFDEHEPALASPAVKFNVSPSSCEGVNAPLPPRLAKERHPGKKKQLEDSYLVADLKGLVAEDDLCFKFSVQVQRDAARQPIEDAFIEWTEAETPSKAIALIRIPKGQDFLSKERLAFCENLAFNPFNGIAAHRPLGETMRARNEVYAFSRSLRQKNLGQKPIDPSAGR